VLEEIKLQGELSEIEFKFHPTVRGAVQGVKFFPNGYGVSITTNLDGNIARGNWKDRTFEISVLRKIDEEVIEEDVSYNYEVLDESSIPSLEEKDPDFDSFRENWGIWIDASEDELINKIKIISELIDKIKIISELEE
jgi:hypothetical protein